ncbi:MAG TPA: ATP-binding protein, partial [Myxococcaceae bacterium]|nr:ATP-binding protein [Myxococcaceae bacterium]
ADALLLEGLASGGRFRLKILHVERLQDGLAHLRHSSFDVVLLDLSLPDAQGVETVAQTYATRRDVPIVILTGLDDEQVAIQAMHAGAQDYLVKGQFDHHLLARAILYARERKRAEAAQQRLVREQSARASAEAAERNARFLADASRALVSSLEPDEMLANLAKLTVPGMADGFLVDLGGHEGKLRRVAALATASGARVPWQEDLDMATALAGDPVAHALRSGESIDFPALSQDVATRLRLPPESSHLLGRTASVAPMIARGRTLGALTLIAWSGDQPRGNASLLAAELAGRVALAVDNARLYHARELLLEVVSRDLHVPLATIMAHLPSPGDQLPPRSQLETMARAASQMTYMVEDLLDMGRLERGAFVLERGPVDVGALLHEVAKSFHPVAERRGVQLEVSVPPGLPQVSADQRRLTQVLWSLWGSGLRFTPSGGRLGLSVETGDDELRVEIANEGRSIPDGQIHRLFDRRWQDENAEPGTGVGLAVARSIIEAHGGRIGAQQTATGNRIFFTLPRSRR